MKGKILCTALVFFMMALAVVAYMENPADQGTEESRAQ